MNEGKGAPPKPFWDVPKAMKEMLVLAREAVVEAPFSHPHQSFLPLLELSKSSS